MMESLITLRSRGCEGFAATKERGETADAAVGPGEGGELATAFNGGDVRK